MPKLAVIISTYNQPKWLEKCLWSYDCQTFKDFEVVIADDGSGPETTQLIERLQRELSYPIQHIWHNDEGFQKCVILNRATLAAKNEYLLFTDGDCLARKDLLATHAKLAQRGYFLSGSYFKMSDTVSHSVTQEDIISQNIFSPKFLRSRGQVPSYKMLRLGQSETQFRVLDSITTTKAAWNGHCSSGWKEDIISVNGHNETMKYGGQDRELSERLMNSGIIPLQIRHRSCVLHLDHPRAYKAPDSIAENKAIRKIVSSEKRVWAEQGITKTKAPQPKLNTYLINLDRSPERLGYSDEELQTYDIPYTRIRAIDGEDLNIKDYPQATANSTCYHTPLTINEVACYLSHLKALETFLASDATHALILEDDFAFTTDPLPCLQELMNIPDWDIVKAYLMKDRKLKRLDKTFSTAPNSAKDTVEYSLHTFASTPICNTAQVFTREGARKFLSHKNHLTRPVDVDLKHYWERNLKIKSLTPSLVTELKQSQQVSTIGHKKPKKNTTSALYKISYSARYNAVKLWHYFVIKN